MWSHARISASNKDVRGCETAVCDTDSEFVQDDELTAEYIMNLSALPCSMASEKFLRMAFSNTPGELTKSQQSKLFFCRHQHNPFDPVEPLPLALSSLSH